MIIAVVLFIKGNNVTVGDFFLKTCYLLGK